MAGLATAGALLVGGFVWPGWQREGAAGARLNRNERAAQQELLSLAAAQERRFASSGRYALELGEIPWRSGLNVYVRVRRADSMGFVARATTSGPEPADCTVEVSRRSAQASESTITRLACTPR